MRFNDYLGHLVYVDTISCTNILSYSPYNKNRRLNLTAVYYLMQNNYNAADVDKKAYVVPKQNRRQSTSVINTIVILLRTITKQEDYEPKYIVFCYAKWS